MNNSNLQMGGVVPNIPKNQNISQQHIRDIVNNTMLNTEEINKAVEKMTEEKEKRYQDSVIREERMIELLESIDKNTSVLNDIFKILEDSKEDQKAILDIISSFNSLATINEPEKAQSKYRKIMNKITIIINDANTIATLCSYGNLIYNTLHGMGKI